MNKILSSLILLLGLLTIGCSTLQNHRERGPASANQEIDYSLPGFNETILVSNSTGKMVLLKISETSYRTTNFIELSERPMQGRSFAGKFFVLMSNGTIHKIDPALQSVVKTISVETTDARDLEIVTDSQAYVSTKAGFLLKINLETGETLGKLDLNALATPGGTVGLGEMLAYKNQLFIQVQRQLNPKDKATGLLAILDLSTFTLNQPVVELKGATPKGLMILDAPRNKLYLTAKGYGVPSASPLNKGRIHRFDLSTMQLDDWTLEASSFQGPIALSSDGTNLFCGYHTKTPTDSTHLNFMHSQDGAFIKGEGVLLEAFEKLPELPSNQTRTLFAFPVSCPVTFCNGGKGISFVNTSKGTVYPRLSADIIGVAPSFVLFL